MNRISFSLPFIENRNQVLGATIFISLLLHGLLLGMYGMGKPLTPVKKQKDTGISIDLEIMESPARQSPLQYMAETGTAKAGPVQQEIPKPEPVHEEAPEPKPVSKPEPTSVKKPKQTHKRFANKSAADSTGSNTKTHALQKDSHLPETNGSAKTAAGETAKPVPAGGSSTPKPPYPELARKRGQEGTVNVRCHVDNTGQVTDVSLAKSSGYRLLDEAALQTVRKWKFKPGKKDGIKTADTVIVPVQFKLR